MTEDERKLRESIACDLLEIGSAVMVAKPPATAETPEQRACWRYGWLAHCLYGYCDTDLGTPHGSGEDMSGWRKEAAAQGIDVSRVDGTSGEEDARAREQRRLYAEAMAPRIAEQMLDGMRGEE